MNIRDQKKHLRDSINERILCMSDNKRAAEHRSLCKRILENLPSSPLTICAYMPLKNEADIKDILQELLTRGDRLYLPVFHNNQLTFRLTKNLRELIPGKLNILEPKDPAPELDPNILDIALIPARAFDRKGWRLGRGNGGYDKWIRAQRAVNAHTKFWGIALECQIVNEVPREEHDEKVDVVITARGFVSHLPRGEG